MAESEEIDIPSNIVRCYEMRRHRDAAEGAEIDHRKRGDTVLTGDAEVNDVAGLLLTTHSGEHYVLELVPAGEGDSDGGGVRACEARLTPVEYEVDATFERNGYQVVTLTDKTLGHSPAKAVKHLHEKLPTIAISPDMAASALEAAAREAARGSADVWTPALALAAARHVHDWLRGLKPAAAVEGSGIADKTPVPAAGGGAGSGSGDDLSEARDD